MSFVDNKHTANRNVTLIKVKVDPDITHVQFSCPATKKNLVESWSLLAFPNYKESQSFENFLLMCFAFDHGRRHFEKCLTTWLHIFDVIKSHSKLHLSVIFWNKQELHMKALLTWITFFFFLAITELCGFTDVRPGNWKFRRSEPKCGRFDNDFRMFRLISWNLKPK